MSPPEITHTPNPYTCLHTHRYIIAWNNNTHNKITHTAYPDRATEKRWKNRAASGSVGFPNEQWTSWLYKQCQPATLYLSRSLSHCLTSASWPCPWPLSSCPSQPLPRQNWNTAITSCMYSMCTCVCVSGCVCAHVCAFESLTSSYLHVKYFICLDPRSKIRQAIKRLFFKAAKYHHSYCSWLTHMLLNIWRGQRK